MSSKNKTWAGTFTLVEITTFAVSSNKPNRSFSGTATVYAFLPFDSKCKVAYAAVIYGVDHSMMCSSSGDVGNAILRSAGLYNSAKNSGLNGDYDTFPEPIGCPIQHLESHPPKHVLTFYRK